MNSPMIELKGVGKEYPLYTSANERFWALVLGSRAKRSNRALNDINLTIGRGEKVGLIGRNGAGKSTLLKIITRAIDPSEGSVEVQGRSHALLQLGVGFHPEFTGRENAHSFIAHLGYVGKRATELVDEAVDFAEIEEYVDQPLKTYSSGMAARLMFGVSTVIEPELLVVDEVLGVGDAYFQNKSFERIRDMCDNAGTTLVLVSHDVYSAAKLCDRMIWVDQGNIYADGEPADIVKLYETSIRLQEDSRQKHKLAMRYRDTLSQIAEQPFFIEIRARGNEPAAAPVHFSEIALIAPDGSVVSLPVLHEQVQTAQFVAERLPHTAWGDISKIDGEEVRSWNNFGTVDHKIGIALFPAARTAREWLEESELHLRCYANDRIDADVVFIDGGERILARLESAPGEWLVLRAKVRDGSKVTSADRVQVRETSGVNERQGSGKLILTGSVMLDEHGKQSFCFQHGADAVIRLPYRINDPSLAERCQVVLAFKRNGIDDVMRLRCVDLLFDFAQAASGAIEVDLSPITLGVGSYALTVLIAKEGYYEHTDGRFFSINPDVYDCQSGIIEFEVQDNASLLSVGTGVVGRADFHLRLPETAAGHDEG